VPIMKHTRRRCRLLDGSNARSAGHKLRPQPCILSVLGPPPPLFGIPITPKTEGGRHDWAFRDGEQGSEQGVRLCAWCTRDREGDATHVCTSCSGPSRIIANTPLVSRWRATTSSQPALKPRERARVLYIFGCPVVVVVLTHPPSRPSFLPAG